MTELVRMQRVTFRAGPSFRAPRAVRTVEPLPRDTLDPRYPLCWNHHTACLCREAEHAEDKHELRHDLDSVRSAALEVLAGHRLFDFRDPTAPSWRGDGALACQCTGCRLMRLADLAGLIRHTDEHGVVLTRATTTAASSAESGARP